MKKKILLVLGARSDIGIAVAHRFAKEGFQIQLAARNSSDLKNDCDNISLRFNVKTSFHEFDALNYNSHESFIEDLPNLPTVVISAFGCLGKQKESEKYLTKALEVIRTNYEGVISIFESFANHFKSRGSGTLIGISSVAGDRGRGSNYIYGSAKAGLSTFLSGLRNRLYPFGVDVITIKPGYVRTKMTSELQLPQYLTTNPNYVADCIFKAYRNKKGILYITRIWFYIMKIIQIIPECLFKRMKL